MAPNMEEESTLFVADSRANSGASRLDGQQRGEDEERHLWPEMFRVIREVRPRYVVAENVPGIITRGFDTVAALLEAEGFTVWPFTVPACAVGTPHRRDGL